MINFSMRIDYTIPLWGVVSFIVPLFVSLIWIIIKMWFKLNSHQSRIVELESTIEKQTISIKQDVLRNEEYIKKEVSMLNDNIRTLSNNVIKLTTLTELLVGDKIKK